MGINSFGFLAVFIIDVAESIQLPQMQDIYKKASSQ